MRRVVVTGMGIVSPLGLGVENVWRRLCKGESGIRRIEHFDTSDLKSKIAGVVPRGTAPGELNVEAFVNSKEYARIADFILYAIVAAQEAVADSGFVPDSEESREMAGVIIGAGIGGIGTIADNTQAMLEKGTKRVSPYFIPASLINEASGHVSIRHGLKGPNHAVVTACATGAQAIGDASRFIMFGDADVMVAGGTEAAVNRITISGFGNMNSLSTDFNETPQRASRPWDKDRDGFIIAEGAGILVLEEYEHAKKRGAKIYAEVLGYGLAGDAYHISAPDKNGSGAHRAMKSALRHAGLGIGDISYLNAHATSTPAGDYVELTALRRLLDESGADYKGLKVSSTKSAVGHLLGGAGAVEAIFAILAMRDNIVPPTLNLDNPEFEFPVDLCPGTARETKIKNVLSNSFGFGGTNAALVFGRKP
jgi:3-oxoacyl-[acyl-carrier-protein] synthase II